MTILLLGGGGREHAMTDALSQSPSVSNIIVAPGNPGVEAIATRLALDILDPAMVVAAAKAVRADLVVVGPEAPLAVGLSDALGEAGILCFGPTKAAAQMESSKVFAKEVMFAAGVPTAHAESFADAEKAKAYIHQSNVPLVVKADGLAAGKGVVVPDSVAATIAAVAEILGGRFGAAGTRVLLEDFLEGEELSVFAITDGEIARIVGSAQDHKRAHDGDQGPNTGGMGAYSPAPFATPELLERVQREILTPVLAELRRRGHPYRGVLYVGLMVENGAPRVVEFNARFGDPEAQVVLPLLKGDLAEIMRCAAKGPGNGLADAAFEISADAALCVTLAAKGYPGSVRSGEQIRNLAVAAALPGVMVYHAGTDQTNGAIVSKGGRVLTVVGRAPTLAEARIRAYAAVDAIDWPGGFHRSDIGWRALGALHP